MRKYFVSAVCLLVLTSLSTAVFAAPARLITKPPVVSLGYPFTGPAIDPPAAAGQWFLDVRTGVQESRPLEFYDNIIPEGGGFAGSDAITGFIAGVTFGGGGIPGVDPIVAFSIRATITNDLAPPPTQSPPGAPGTNSHEEELLPGPRYFGTMYDVKLTTEFALPAAGVPVPIPVGTPPYIPIGTPINAENYDQLAWYCWSPAGTDPAFPPGGYVVPTYDFGDIPVGASVTRTLDFTSAILPGDPLYPLFLTPSGQLLDLFLNRTTDLKIGDYVDVLGVDTGVAYPATTRRSGDVSVFFNPIPEPSTYALVLAGLGVAAYFSRRRKTA